jgi:DMSO/TMAO reductase YedYZ molybdopterin-dependent catalytic subunit
MSYADLVAMPQVELKDILMEKSVGEDTVGSWSGVSLAEILNKAGAGTFASVTAVAADGYAIEVSQGELEGGIIALKENGEWIATADPDHGPIRMVTPHTPANRWVFQLAEIQVNSEAAGSIPANAALKVTGNVETEVGWTAEKLISMDPVEAEYTKKDGSVKTYAGVPINDLLGKAGVAADAATIVLVADDDYSEGVEWGELQGCGDCIVAADGDSFRSVLPGFASSAQVKGLVEIQVK